MRAPRDRWTMDGLDKAAVIVAVVRPLRADGPSCIGIVVGCGVFGNDNHGDDNHSNDNHDDDEGNEASSTTRTTAGDLPF